MVEAAEEQAIGKAAYLARIIESKLVTGLENAGRTPAEMAEIEAASKRAAKNVPTSTYTENLKVLNETTGAFGSLHHAIENLEFVQKAASVIHAAAGDKVHEGAPMPSATR